MMFDTWLERGSKRAYTIKDVVDEIDYCVAYLMDAPDDVLAAYADEFGDIGDRLRKLKECLRTGDA